MVGEARISSERRPRSSGVICRRKMRSQFSIVLVIYKLTEVDINNNNNNNDGNEDDDDDDNDYDDDTIDDDDDDDDIS